MSHASHPMTSVPTACMQSRNTALILAADAGHFSMVKLLLDRGAQKDLRDEVTQVGGCAYRGHKLVW